MERFLRILAWVVWVCLLPLWPIFWAQYRFSALPCPRCGSGWCTELVGECEVEQWECRYCHYYWEVPADRGWWGG